MTKLSVIQLRERDALADDLRSLSPEQWRSPTLCGEWDVEEVVAHLGAASRLSFPGWLRSMIGARFDPDVHNRRRLEEFRGSSPEETLARFVGIGPIRLPRRESVGGLGEMIVHSEDIRRPLGIRHDPDPEGLLAVATFFATKDFAVNSKSLVAGLRLRAVDAAYVSGEGPEVSGRLLDLVMAMAGRREVLDGLVGDGVPELTQRLG
ncbi:maleylpyruvate isomerase family mycothiol-dependent enzyme [Nocardioides sp. NPDC101246]|uniref:maleylpyruvate isomerase family mycothiol-dependent enzyme n=1 Tax=Nocardioides sp. NPDC101246 TaxID=3364336 RepID=UPI003823E4B5